MIRRRKDETSKQLLARLDLAIASGTIDDIYVDEVNAPRADIHIFCDRSCALEEIMDTYGPIPHRIYSAARRPEKHAYPFRTDVLLRSRLATTGHHGKSGLRMEGVEIVSGKNR